MKKLLAVLIVISMFAFPTLALAQSVESATVSADTIQKSIQDRIKKALQDNLKAAKKTVDQQQPHLRAFIGSVETITENTISLSVDNGDTKISKQVQVTSDTTIVVDNKSGQRLDKIAVGSQVIAMGYTTDNQTLHTIRLVVQALPTPKFTFKPFSGTLTDISIPNKTLTLSAGGDDQTFALSKKYVLVDNQLKTLELKALPIDRFAVAILITDTAKDITKLDKLLVWGAPATVSAKKKTTEARPICGDKICQDNETPETCPMDCTK